MLISLPPYFEISTLSPFFTVKSIFFPFSSILPVPTATTFPSCGFSLAVSGLMIAPFALLWCRWLRKISGAISKLFLLFLLVVGHDFEFRIDNVALAFAGVLLG